MSIPYRVRKGMNRFLVTLTVLLVIAAAGLTAWFVWLSRFVVYTQNGARFDFQLGDFEQGVLAQPPRQQETVSVQYGDAEDTDQADDGQLKQLSGYTVSLEMLESDFEGVKAQLEALPKGSTVMLDMKTVQSEYLYDSGLGRSYDKVDGEQMTQLILNLRSKGCYLIAAVPSFQEYWYILDDQSTRVPYGLPKKGGGGSLWLDTAGPNYWMDPTSAGTLNLLVQVATQLRELGFHEVLFRDFRFPNTDKISFSGEKTAALDQAAQTLVKACASGSFTVSFGASTSLTLPQGRCRLYLTDVAASDIYGVIGEAGVADPQTQMVFLTDLKDTRFDQYGVLRPLEIG